LNLKDKGKAYFRKLLWHRDRSYW